MPAKRKAASPKDSSAILGFESKFWLSADNTYWKTKNRKQEQDQAFETCQECN